MIAPSAFVTELQANGVEYFCGVPDSLLKPFGQYVSDELPESRHTITANEGTAVAMAIGRYLATGQVPLVYLQNSGLGNVINPLLSLADADVYGIPLVVLVGWRGQPSVPDEPQHVKQGRVMVDMIDAMQLPCFVLPLDPAEARDTVASAVDRARSDAGPVFLLVEKGTFAAEAASPMEKPAVMLPTREEALDALLGELGAHPLIISTTGMLSRELFEIRVRDGADGAQDFLTVGGMGHASSIALGVAEARPDREVWCLDGDGALLMHLGALASIGDRSPMNYHHVVFNNGVHDSVGGQPTSIGAVDIPNVARSVGYASAETATGLEVVAEHVVRMRDCAGPSLLELRVRPGARSDLGRPTRTPRESAQRFMAALAAD